MESTIRVITAVFEDPVAADHALEALSGLNEHAYGDLRAAPFGRLVLGPDADTTVLAGRLSDEFVPDATLVIEQHGGLLVSDIDARRTGWKDRHDPS